MTRLFNGTAVELPSPHEFRPPNLPPVRRGIPANINHPPFNGGYLPRRSFGAVLFRGAKFLRLIGGTLPAFLMAPTNEYSAYDEYNPYLVLRPEWEGRSATNWEDVMADPDYFLGPKMFEDMGLYPIELNGKETWVPKLMYDNADEMVSGHYVPMDLPPVYLNINPNKYTDLPVRPTDDVLAPIHLFNAGIKPVILQVHRFVIDDLVRKRMLDPRVDMTTPLKYTYNPDPATGYPVPPPNVGHYYSQVLVTKYNPDGTSYMTWEWQFDVIGYTAAVQSWEISAANWDAQEAARLNAEQQQAIEAYNAQLAFIARVNTANEFVVEKAPRLATEKWGDKTFHRRDGKSDDALVYRRFLYYLNNTVGREGIDYVMSFYQSLVFDERKYFRENPWATTLPKGFRRQRVEYKLRGKLEIRNVVVPVTVHAALREYRRGYIDVDLGRLIEALVMNHIEDSIIGKLNQGVKNIYKDPLYNRPVGLSVGPAL